MTSFIARGAFRIAFGFGRAVGIKNYNNRFINSIRILRMNKISKFTFLFFSVCSLITQSAHAQENPRAVPANQFEKISALAGIWKVKTEIFNLENQKWREVGQNIVSNDIIMNGMGLRETPIKNVSGNALGVETTISYDQDRQIFRISAVDDTGEEMDSFEGIIEGNKLIATNIEKGTDFPAQDGGTMEFRLNMTLGGDTRVTEFSFTTNSGQTWRQLSRLTYVRQ